MSESTQSQAELQSAQSEGETPKVAPITVEQMNAAITARMKALETKVENSIGSKLTDFSTKLSETLAQQFEAMKPKEAPPADKGKDTPKVEDPAVKQLREELAAMKQANQRIDSERKAERAKAREATLRSSVTNALTATGMPAALAKKAVFELVDGTKRVGWQSDESESLVFKTDDGEHLDLDSGLKSWLGSEDAKFYKAPTGTTGSGDRSGAGGGSRTPPSAEAQMLDTISKHFNLSR